MTDFLDLDATLVGEDQCLEPPDRSTVNGDLPSPQPPPVHHSSSQSPPSLEPVRDDHQCRAASMTSGGVDAATLTCGLCSRLLQRPRVLSCLHTFCEQCLQRSYEESEDESGQLSCITCSTTTRLDERGAAALPYDWLAQSQVDMQRVHLTANASTASTTVVPCDGCHALQALARCVNCALFVCASCQAVHQAKFVNHRVMSFAELCGESDINVVPVHRVVTCAHHADTPVSHYCHSCTRPVCEQCVAVSGGEHAGCDHNTSRISDIEQHEWTDLLHLVDNAKTQMKQMDVSGGGVQAALNQLQQSHERACATIERQWRALAAAVEQQAAAARQRCDQLHSGKKQTLMSLGEQCEKGRRRLAEALTHADRLLELANCAELLSVKAVVVQRVDACCQPPLPPHDLSLAYSCPDIDRLNHTVKCLMGQFDEDVETTGVIGGDKTGNAGGVGVGVGGGGSWVSTNNTSPVEADMAPVLTAATCSSAVSCGAVRAVNSTCASVGSNSLSSPSLPSPVMSGVCDNTGVTSLMNGACDGVHTSSSSSSIPPPFSSSLEPHTNTFSFQQQQQQQHNVNYMRYLSLQPQQQQQQQQHSADSLSRCGVSSSSQPQHQPQHQPVRSVAGAEFNRAITQHQQRQLELQRQACHQHELQQQQQQRQQQCVRQTSCVDELLSAARQQQQQQHTRPYRLHQSLSTCDNHAATMTTPFERMSASSGLSVGQSYGIPGGDGGVFGDVEPTVSGGPLDHLLDSGARMALHNIKALAQLGAAAGGDSASVVAAAGDMAVVGSHTPPPSLAAAVNMINAGDCLTRGLQQLQCSATPSPTLTSCLQSPGDTCSLLPLPAQQQQTPGAGSGLFSPSRPGSSSSGSTANMQIRCKFGQLGQSAGQFNSPHGFCLGVDEELVVADTNNHRIQVFDKNGEHRFMFGAPGKEEGQLWYPRKVAVIRSSGKYVICDRGSERSRMQVFSRNGYFIKKISIRCIDIVAGLAISASGHIVVVDSVTPTVFVLSETGALVHWFDCSDHMREPSDIAVVANEYYICDFKNHCVCVFDACGKYQRRLGADSITNFPNGIDVSDAGDVLVGDSHGNRFHVTVFSRSGEVLSEFECPQVKVSRCCGLKLTSEGFIITIAKNNHHVLILNTLYIS